MRYPGSHPIGTLMLPETTTQPTSSMSNSGSPLFSPEELQNLSSRHNWPENFGSIDPGMVPLPNVPVSNPQNDRTHSKATIGSRDNLKGSGGSK